MSVLLIVVGLGVLTFGAELLIRGSSRIATTLGLPSLVIGLTVVAFGTSAPELAVSVGAVLTQDAGIAIGNAVGSNTFNILFILGLSSLVTPLVVSSQLVRLDVPVMIAVAALTWLLAADGSLSRIEGIALFVILIAYTGTLMWLGLRGGSGAGCANGRGLPETEVTPKEPPKRVLVSILLTVAGLVLLVAGARLLVHGATDLARALGVSDLMIGLTIVAAGTSLPELATSLLAAVRGQRDIAVGNVVGSNIFNMLGVLGISSLSAPHPIAVDPVALSLDFPVMLAACVVCLPLFLTGARVSRTEGGLLVGFYAAYVVFMGLAAVRHESLPLVRMVLWIALPLAGLGIMLSVAHWLASRRQG